MASRMYNQCGEGEVEGEGEGEGEGNTDWWEYDEVAGGRCDWWF